MRYLIYLIFTIFMISLQQRDGISLLSFKGVAMPEINITINIDPRDLSMLPDEDIDSLADQIRDIILDRLYIKGLNTHDVEYSVRYN